MDELLAQFLIESRELVAQAARDFALLGRDPQDGKAIDSAFRALHTLKGSFAIFDLPPAERLLHGAEDVLDRARKGAALTPSTITALVACLDQTDRWIDAMEQCGALPSDADTLAGQALELFSSAPAAPLDKPAGDWLATLLLREAQAIEQAGAPLTAFRYRPDAQCFFRGEDPLAVVEAAPQLVALAILPADGAWPLAADMEPFSCFSTIEGLSAADEATLRAAFRLQGDQVDLAAVAPVTQPHAPHAALPGPSLLRIEAGRIDALADGLRDLVVAINGLAALAGEVEKADVALAARLRGTQSDIERVTTGLVDQLARVRLVPLEPSLRRLPRAAREIAQSLGKPLAFTLEGEAVEADKQIAEGLFEPLLHLLRNAIDHGIETPETRQARGKPTQGQVRLMLAREGDAITATLSDDGAGMDPAQIRRKAIERGLLDARQPMPEDAATLRLIFEPGFSTAASVTDLSGRGVGLDAVQTAVLRLRGTIAVESTPGLGTRFHMRFPAHALTTRLLVVDLGPEQFGLALDQVVETVRIEASAIRPLGSGHVCVLRGRSVPVLDLAVLLDLPAASVSPARLVVAQGESGPVALRVDGFARRVDTVLHPPRGVLARAHGVTGSALLEDGSVLLVLDLPALIA